MAILAGAAEFTPEQKALAELLGKSLGLDEGITRYEVWLKDGDFDTGWLHQKVSKVSSLTGASAEELALELQERIAHHRS